MNTCLVCGGTLNDGFCAGAWNGDRNTVVATDEMPHGFTPPNGLSWPRDVEEQCAMCDRDVPDGVWLCDEHAAAMRQTVAEAKERLEP